MKAVALLPSEVGAFCPLAATTTAMERGTTSQAMLVAPGLRVTRCEFAAGQELSEHASPARLLLQVIGGRCAFSFGGQTCQLGPGDLLHLPPRVPHALRAITDLTVLLIQASDSAPTK